MNQINKINMSALSNSAHDAFVTEVNNRAKANEKVAAQSNYTVFANKVAKEDELLKISQRNDLTEPIREADKERDKYYLGYKNAVKSFLSMPAGDKLTAAEKLQQHIDDYKIVQREQLDKQTSDMGNMVTDLETKFSAQIATLGLAAFVENMKTANDQVRTLLQQRDDQGPAIEVGALKAARAETDKAYNNLVIRINALWVTDYDDLYDKFISETNRQIARFKEQMKSRKTKKQTDETSDTTTEE